MALALAQAEHKRRRERHTPGREGGKQRHLGGVRVSPLSEVERESGTPNPR